jgi:hypothetical protein
LPWIEIVRPDEAQGELADLYRAIAGARGGVADVHQVQSLNPRAMSAHTRPSCSSAPRCRAASASGGERAVDLAIGNDRLADTEALRQLIEASAD